MINDQDILSADFSNVLKKKIYSDITLKFDKVEFKLHRNILACRSEYFR